MRRLLFAGRVAFNPALGKAGRDDDGGPRLLLVAFLEHAKHFVVRDDNADKVRRFGQVADSLIPLMPLISS